MVIFLLITLVRGHREIKLVLTRKHVSRLLVFRGVVQAAEGEKSLLVLPTCEPGKLQ